MTVNAHTPVGEIATEHPLATRVFARHSIDFCCAGQRPLDEVCSAKNLDAHRLLDEIQKEVTGTSTPEIRWDHEPVSSLIDHILETYHKPLKEELPRLEAMAQKVHEVHGDKDPALGTILRTVRALRQELELHMMKEEQVLFPMILAGNGALAIGPIAAMESEHENAGGLLSRLKELTRDFEVPDGACTTWRALWAGLADLESSLHRHIHLENNILHKRALDS